jgi:hypothetical protein
VVSDGFGCVWQLLLKLLYALRSKPMACISAVLRDALLQGGQTGVFSLVV